MKRQVDIYIEGTTVNDYLKLDLFEDEKINISSSIQNVQDISKVYTDFTQSFTVPASENNNKIFEYFYQNDLDNAIDHNLRRFAYIEIGLVPFRTGKIQLEGSSVKNGKVQHYSITFYGDLISLKDTFGIKKIGDLNYSFVTEIQTGTDVKDRITDTLTDYDIRYPLISSQNIWSYQDGNSTDITTSIGRIDSRELFPAIKVSKIFQAIENDFGLTFQSTFLQSERFKKLFLWCKNIDDPTLKQYKKDLTYNYIQFIAGTGGIAPRLIYSDPSFASGEFNLTSLNNGKPLLSEVYFSLNYTTTPAILGIEIYRNGVYHSTQYVNATSANSVKIYSVNGNTYDEKISFKISSDIFTTIKYSIRVNQTSTYTVTVGNVTYQFFNDYGGTIVGQSSTFNINTAYTSIASNMPDITIADFFSGILKQFNLTCYSVGVDTFQIEPLDHWYSKGAVIDVTKYVDIDTISVDRLPLYKKVAFNYQKSESFLNRQFGNASGKEWGDISNDYPYDGGDYNISVPFENLQFYKFKSGIYAFQVGYALTNAPDFKPYVPKPVLLYYTSAASANIKFYNGTTESTLSNVALFGQDLVYNNQVYSLNFSSDNSTWFETLINNSLFATYYFGYLANLFNTKNRLTKIKAYFPIGLITSLRLNDRLIIQDKRYIINSINSDITTGEVSLELINDLRQVVNL